MHHRIKHSFVTAAVHPYDFLIGSIHSIDGLLYDMNGFSREILWDKYDTNAIYRRYYEIMEDMIESDLFTQIGHPDQLKIFHYEPDYDLKPTYERLAVLAKEHDVDMETNTGCHYRYLHEDVGTNQVFLEILKAHGVKIMTASDAHKTRGLDVRGNEGEEHIAEISRLWNKRKLASWTRCVRGKGNYNVLWRGKWVYILKMTCGQTD